MTRVQAHHSEISPQKFGSDEMGRIVLNVGGQKHETYLSTVGHLPDTRLYWIIESVVKSPDYDPETSEIFFDRHPSVFAQILNYYRTGKLHCPTDVCGPLFEQELNYWGIDEKDMEPCCWVNYTQHRDAEANLKNVLYEATSEDPIMDTLSVGQQSTTHIWRKIQPLVWAILDESRSSKRAKVFSFISVFFIILSVAMFCINTLPDLKMNKSWRLCCDVVEHVCGIFFTLEFLLRVVFCPHKRAFAFAWTTWIDFLAVIPFYLKLIVKDPGDAINVLLVIRLLRLFRFFRLIYGLQVLSHTLKASSYELLLLLFMLFIPVIIFSSAVFFIENSLTANTKFHSIPHSFWWSLITITTVGYGDIHPVSWPGKVVGCMCAICGVLIVALPVSIIGGNFTLFYTHAQARLKLPKKKKKVFLPQASSTIYTERVITRSGAIRRKVSRRPSESHSVTCEGSRLSSVQGNRTSLPVNGYPRRKSRISNGGTEEIKMMPRKKISAVSIKMPGGDDGQQGEQHCERHQVITALHTSLGPPDWEYSKFDSAPHVSRRNMYSDVAVDSPRPDVLEADAEFDVNGQECSSNRENKDLDKSETPETTPLLSSTSNPIITKPDDSNDTTSQTSEIIRKADIDEQKQYFSQLLLGEKRASLDSINSHGERTRLAGADRDETTTQISPRPSFPSININDNKSDEDSINLSTSLGQIHFNRRRRNPVF